MVLHKNMLFDFSGLSAGFIMLVRRYSSPLGDLIASSDGDSLLGLRFDDQNDAPENTVYSQKTDIFRQLDLWLDIYFSGRDPKFTPKLGICASAFQQTVWRIILTIPFGATMTYGEIAAKISEKDGSCMSARAVGRAVGHNQFALVVPCHRVIGSDGSLTGYAWGLHRKSILLSMEKAGERFSRLSE